MSKFGRAGDVLDRAISAGRLHHAILLYGESIADLDAAAIYVAQRLLNTQDPRKHPDFFELRPQGRARFIKIGSDSDRAGGDWPPNTMRWLLEKLSQTSNAGGRKVAVIHEADRMNNVAANAFLKTLEEPSSDTNILMLSERPNDLLDTIRSRCINLRINCAPRRIDDEQWSEWLEDFRKWQANLSEGFGSGFTPSDALIASYSLLARFDSILTRLSDIDEHMNMDEQEHLDEEELAAIEVGERRSLRKRLLAEIEEEMISSALEASKGRVPSMRLSRSLACLEKCAGFMELNMPDTPALEYFFLNTLRIWSR